MFANVTGKYVFDIDNPDKSHIEIKNVSCIDISDVSIHYSKSYTGIVTSFERQEDFIVVTLNTTDIKFKCPINSIKAIDLTKQINISVDVYMEPDSPQTSDNYTVTEVNQM